MAKRTIHLLIDDLDGKNADETVKFAIDGIQYEIDLSSANAGKLRAALKPFVDKGTKIGRVGDGPARRTRPLSASGRGPASNDPDQNRAIREWAQAKGIQVSDRGRIKQEIVDRFHAEAGRPPAQASAPAQETLPVPPAVEPTKVTVPEPEVKPEPSNGKANGSKPAPAKRGGRRATAASTK